jgi:hypothetical protein
MMHHKTYSQPRPSFSPRGPVHVGFVAEKVTLEQIPFPLFQYCNVTVIPYTHSRSMLIYSSSVCIISITDSAV